MKRIYVAPEKKGVGYGGRCVYDDEILRISLGKSGVGLSARIELGEYEGDIEFVLPEAAYHAIHAVTGTPVLGQQERTIGKEGMHALVAEVLAPVLKLEHVIYLMQGAKAAGVREGRTQKVAEFLAVLRT